MKNNIIAGIASAFLSFWFMFWVTGTKAFADVQGNFLFVFLLLFFVVALFGYGVSMLVGLLLDDEVKPIGRH